VTNERPPRERPARPQAEQQAAVEEAPSFDDTIWPRVDRALSGVTATPERGVLDLIVRVPRDEIIRALRTLKQDPDLKFDYLRDLTAVDLEDEGMEVVYHLYSIEKNHNVTVKTSLPNDDLVVDTATTVWRGANWYEREVMEMFGIQVRNHPDPRNLLMPEDMTDTFPLRKDHPLQEIEVLQGEGMGYEEDGS
jgi:NADH-quinone oxidoreductase subunit C